MGDSVATIYINGILSPKDETHWDSMRVALERSLGGDVYHIHNPFIAVNQQDIVRMVAENPHLAITFAAISFSSLAFLASSSDDTAMKSLEFIAKGLEGVLRERAVSFQSEIIEGLEHILSNNAAEHLKSGSKRYERINIFAHSHGGMCIDEFLKSDVPKELQEKYGIELAVYVGGCPVIVSSHSSDVKELVQIHNHNDVLSLLFSKSNSARSLPETVISTYLDGNHDSLLYAEAIEEVLFSVRFESEL
uniref:Uncharacterized protein n=1 Tax=Aplanochytrium stocchinoi TaxID=215587 RepID=A0A7S3LJI6_9STRA|mmetsp:Transcript_1328/g.1704  ORF Transcript_1328/g.1704 Transcript_1328/m.1704 type:complete len:249 (+) Transcript_1328:99-845(+)